MARPLRIEFPGDEQRERVIAKICRLSTEQLHRVKSFWEFGVRRFIAAFLYGDSHLPAMFSGRSSRLEKESGDQSPHSKIV
jgi:hypothetical protein